MKTKRFITSLSLAVILGLLATVSFGCTNIPQDNSKGNFVKETRNVSDFTKLDIGGAFKVNLAQGDQEKLEIEADQDELKEIITEVVGGKLKIYTESNWGANFHEMTIYLTFKNLDYIDFSGAVEVKGAGVLNFTDLNMDISGAAEIEMAMKADKIDAEFSGASEINFSGNCKSGYLELSGASEFNTENLEFQDLTIEVSGASDAKVWATGILNIDASGASSIRYKGSPKVSVDESGASSVKPM
jgi:hypothetical protein